TPAVRRRVGPSSTRSGATEPVQPWRSRIASYGSGCQASLPAPASGPLSAGSQRAVSLRPSRERSRITSPPSESTAALRPASSGATLGASSSFVAARPITIRSSARLGPTRRRPCLGTHAAFDEPADRRQQPGELGRNDELRRRIGADSLERREILEGLR